MRIQPSSGLNFGYMAILEKRTMHLDIENLGCFPFQYKIFGPKVLDNNMLGSSLIGVDKDEKDQNIEGRTRFDVPTSRSAKLVKPRQVRLSIFGTVNCHPCTEVASYRSGACMEYLYQNKRTLSQLCTQIAASILSIEFRVSTRSATRL